jgi:hypothetical protein
VHFKCSPHDRIFIAVIVVVDATASMLQFEHAKLRLIIENGISAAMTARRLLREEQQKVVSQLLQPPRAVRLLKPLIHNPAKL